MNQNTATQVQVGAARVVQYLANWDILFFWVRVYFLVALKILVE